MNPRTALILVEDHVEVRHEIGAFQEDPETYIDDWRGSGVQGSLVYWKDVPSSHLAATRHVGIRLPPGYHADRRYPVLYMHDGRNLPRGHRPIPRALSRGNHPSWA